MADLTNTRHHIWYNNQPYDVTVLEQNLENDSVRIYFHGALFHGATMFWFNISEFEEMKREYERRKEEYANNGKIELESEELEVKSTYPTMVNSEMKQGYTKTRPSHYDSYGIQVLEMMELVFGKQATVDFCRLNAFKYRMRMGTKDNESFDDDLKKEQYYLEYAKQLEKNI